MLPDGDVLVTAGVSSAGRFSERYQPATGQWPAATGGLGACSSVRECRCGSSATLLGTGEVLVAGGMTGLYSSPGSTTSAMLYDPATSAWTVTGPMSGDRENQTANLLPNGQMLVAGVVSFRNHVGVSDGPGDRRLDGVDVGPGERVYASLWPVGGGFAELALASADRLTPCPTG